jgi:hypothetical protein
MFLIHIHGVLYVVVPLSAIMLLWTNMSLACPLFPVHKHICRQQFLTHIVQKETIFKFTSENILNYTLYSYFLGFVINIPNQGLIEMSVVNVLFIIPWLYEVMYCLYYNFIAIYPSSTWFIFIFSVTVQYTGSNILFHTAHTWKPTFYIELQSSKLNNKNNNYFYFLEVHDPGIAVNTGAGLTKDAPHCLMWQYRKSTCFCLLLCRQVRPKRHTQRFLVHNRTIFKVFYRDTMKWDRFFLISLYSKTWMIKNSRDKKKKKIFELWRTSIIQNNKIANNLLEKLVSLLMVQYAFTCHAITVINCQFMWCSVMKMWCSIHWILYPLFLKGLQKINDECRKMIEAGKLFILNYVGRIVWKLSL